MKILFIDDDELTVEMVQKQCKIRNIAIDVFRDPRTVYSLNLSKYDLIITDYMMPYLNGIDLITYCRVQNPDLYFALITAIDTPALIQEAFSKNIIEFIQKPFDFNKILNVINTVKSYKEITAVSKQLKEIL